MPISVDELISRIDDQVAGLTPNDDPFATARHAALLYLRDVLRQSGYFADRTQRRELSLVPLVFQEANYDDIDWTDRAAPLWQLAGIFEIDVAAQSGGRERHELTDAEYDEYVKMSFAAIDSR